jgi:hypothetical protein
MVDSRDSDKLSRLPHVVKKGEKGMKRDEEGGKGREREEKGEKRR